MARVAEIVFIKNLCRKDIFVVLICLFLELRSIEFICSLVNIYMSLIVDDHRAFTNWSTERDVSIHT